MSAQWADSAAMRRQNLPLWGGLSNKLKSAGFFTEKGTVNRRCLSEYHEAFTDCPLLLLAEKHLIATGSHDILKLEIFGNFCATASRKSYYIGEGNWEPAGSPTNHSIFFSKSATKHA